MMRPQPTRSAITAGQARSAAKLPALQAELLGVLLDAPTLFRSPEADKLAELLTNAELGHIFHAAKQIADARAKYPGINVIVHPECRFETVQAADLNGSTEFITKTITNAPAGSAWAVGTEINLVSRLAKENPDKTVFCLDPVVCPCSTMYRVHPAYLAWTVESLAEGNVVNQIIVPEDIAANAKLALNRMLAIK